jgi:hypothetical protein
MSIFIEDSGENLKSEIHSANPHELCEYLHNIEYELDLPGEELVSFSIVNGELPKGLVLESSGKIHGSPIPLDTYHEVRKYILKEIDKGDDYIPYPRCYETEDDIGNSEKKLTVGYLKSLDGQHYSGRTWGTKGHLAYTRDDPGGEFTKFYFTIDMYTTFLDEETGEILDNHNLREFWIQPIAVWDPEVFCVVYGDSNKSLKNDDGEILTGEEYVKWRKSQGHIFLKKC